MVDYHTHRLSTCFQMTCIFQSKTETHSMLRFYAYTVLAYFSGYLPGNLGQLLTHDFLSLFVLDLYILLEPTKTFHMLFRNVSQCNSRMSPPFNSVLDGDWRSSHIIDDVHISSALHVFSPYIYQICLLSFLLPSKDKCICKCTLCSTSLSRRSGMDHTVLPAVTPMPAFTRSNIPATS